MHARWCGWIPSTRKHGPSSSDCCATPAATAKRRSSTAPAGACTRSWGLRSRARWSALGDAPGLELEEAPELEPIQQLATKLPGQGEQRVGGRAVEARRQRFAHGEQVDDGAGGLEGHGLAVGHDAAAARLVDERPQLAQAPAQRAARVVGDVPEEGAQPLPPLGPAGEREIGEERTGLLRRRQRQDAIAPAQLDLAKDAEMQRFLDGHSLDRAGAPVLRRRGPDFPRSGAEIPRPLPRRLTRWCRQKGCMTNTAHGFTWETTLAAAERATWRLEDVVGGERRLDFARRFLPESLARVEELDFLSSDERLLLNQIRSHGYLHLFATVEEFILPFLMDWARPRLSEDDHRVRAVLQFACEEAKHIHLFKIFRREFADGFPVDCEVIGPSREIARQVLSHHPLGVALTILHVEWMTQRHYLESVRDDGTLDPQFTSLLRHHWMEEAQHARLDTLIIEALARACRDRDLRAGLADYAGIGALLDAGLARQVALDVDGLERAAGRTFRTAERERLVASQTQAMRWTFLGSGMTHPRFLATLDAIAPWARAGVEEIAPAFC